MIAVILGAGRGSRLAPITRRSPKILAPLSNRPILEYQLRYLERQGVLRVALNTHHYAEQVEAFLDRFKPSIEVRLSHEATLLGTAGALRPLRSFLDEPFLLLYGDVVTDVDLQKLHRAHCFSDAVATLAVYPETAVNEKGVCEVDPAGRVKAFIEKPTAPPGTSLVNAGLHVLDPSILAEIPEGFSDFGHDIWPALLAAGTYIQAQEVDGYLRDVGTPESLAQAEQDLQAGLIKW